MNELQNRDCSRKTGKPEVNFPIADHRRISFCHHLSGKTAANVVCDVLAEHTGKLKTGSPTWTTVLTKHPCVAAAAGGQDAVNRRSG
jgi:hypothetical protein